MKINDYLDSYNRTARLYPAFLALLPVISVIAVRTPWFQVEFKDFIWAIPLSAVILLFSDIARHLGKKAESRLIRRWDGLPSIAMLRRNDNRIDSITKNRYLQEAASLIPHLVIPTPESEQSNQEDADSIYQSISNWLRAKTRDKKEFYLLFEENMHYGFHRNLYGLKIPALIILICSIIYIIATSQGNILDIQSFSTLDTAFLFFAVIGIVVWIFGVTGKSVESAGVAYAKQLLMSLDMLYKPEK